MSVSAVGSTSSVIASAFRQSQAADARTGARSRAGRAAEVTPAGGASGSTPAITALRQQLAEAQEALQRLVDANADEQAIRAAQQRVHACASALAAALTQQAAAAAKAERASTAGQYL